MRDIHYSETTLSAWAIEAVYAGARAVFMDEHITGCRICSEKLRFFTNYYRTLKAEQEVNVAPEKPHEEHVLVLKPFQRDRAASSLAVDTRQLVLAAQGKTKSADRFVEVMVYSSSNPPVILRVIEDRQLQTFKAFVLSESPAYTGEFKLNFIDDGGKTATAIANSEGSAVVSVPPGFNWEASHVGMVSIPSK